jgi:hypothetical protein
VLKTNCILTLRTASEWKISFIFGSVDVKTDAYFAHHKTKKTKQINILNTTAFE